MAYYVDVFSPETYQAFYRSSRTITGFRERQMRVAGRVKPGDKLLCYLTTLSRWVGVLEVQSERFSSKKPIFYPSNDPFVIRFKVKPLVLLTQEQGMPIRDDSVWDHLSFTKGLDKTGSRWTGKLRSSLNTISEGDGLFLEQALSARVNNYGT